MQAFAWSGALLFAAALAWFVYQYLITFGAAVSASAPHAAAFDIALFSLFAFHHSLFARTPIRAWMTKYAPRNERTIYVWIASVLFIVVCTLWRPIAGIAWQVDGVARWGLYALQALGVVLTLRGAAILDIRDLAGLPSAAGSRDTGQAPEFRTAGPYGWVRHPIYLGWFLMVLAANPMTMTRLVFALVSCGYLILAIPFEEGTLRRTSGGAYERYMKSVRWKLIPGLY